MSAEGPGFAKQGAQGDVCHRAVLGLPLPASWDGKDGEQMGKALPGLLAPAAAGKCSRSPACSCGGNNYLLLEGWGHRPLMWQPP